MLYVPLMFSIKYCLMEILYCQDGIIFLLITVFSLTTDRCVGTLMVLAYSAVNAKLLLIELWLSFFFVLFKLFRLTA